MRLLANNLIIKRLNYFFSYLAEVPLWQNISYKNIKKLHLYSVYALLTMSLIGFIFSSTLNDFLNPAISKEYIEKVKSGVIKFDEKRRDRFLNDTLEYSKSYQAMETFFLTLAFSFTLVLVALGVIQLAALKASDKKTKEMIAQVERTHTQNKMTSKKALAFLQQNQPMPSDSVISNAFIHYFFDVLKYFETNKDRRCIPLFINSVSDSTCLGMYDHIKFVLMGYPIQEVMPHLKRGLIYGSDTIKNRCCWWAMDINAWELKPEVSLLLQSPNNDLRDSALTFLEVNKEYV